MNTKEFIRIQLDAPADAVRAWLESVAAAAERVSQRTFCLASLEIAPSTPAPISPATKPGTSTAGPKSQTPNVGPAAPIAAGALDAPANQRQHRRRYGVFNGSGVLALNADLRCPDARTTVLELRRDDAFPLVAEELMERLNKRFPGASGEMLAEKPRERSGAPPLACNVWLEDQLRKLPDPARYHHLYADWLAHYVTLRGYEPLDPRRSFRAAARGCIQRMQAGKGA